MIYEQSNEVIKKIQEARYCLIITHINPDADTISCALTLSNYMKENGLKHKVFNESKSLPRSLDFISLYDKITDQIPKFYDLVVFVDCAVKNRVGCEIPDDIFTINIDHHQSNDNFGDINIVDDSKSSTAEVLYEILEKTEVSISKNMAESIYVGIYDDSIGFTTPRVNNRTFDILNKLVEKGISPSIIADKLLRRDSLAKYRIIPKILETLSLHNEGKIATIYLEDTWLKETGATVSECDEVVNMVLNIAIVEVVAYCRVIKGKARVSLRSKGDIDVSKIASSFDGGGHKNAAGLSMDTDSIEDALSRLLKATQSYI